MSEKLWLFYEHLKSYSDYDYLYSYLNYHLAPVLAGIKPGSILNMTGDNKEKWHKYGREIVLKLHLKWTVLRQGQEGDIIFLYQLGLIRGLLENSSIKSYLEQIGYQVLSVNQVIRALKGRYDKVHCPHEVGIFLGIPLEDVRVFIEKPQTPCLLKGYWKVYSNLEDAKTLFEAYDDVKYQVVYENLSREI